MMLPGSTAARRPGLRRGGQEIDVQREIEYATSTGGIDIAYRVIGDGPVDLVFVSGFITHLDLTWQLPHIEWLERLDGIARVITFDKRGTGLSDRSLGFGSLEERTDDIRAVMDAIGCRSAFLLGMSEGGPMSILFAASAPERVRGLMLYGTMAKLLWAPGYEIGLPQELGDAFLDFVAERWGTGEVFGLLMQHAPDEQAARRLIARFERNACTPNMAVEIMRRNYEIDVRPVLGAVTVPTLVLHTEEDPAVPCRLGRYVAEHIPGAEFRALSGDFHGSWLPEENELVWQHVVEFLTSGSGPVAATDRVLATVVFTDIVGSTDTTNRIGDAAWHGLLDQHDRVTSASVDRFGGRLIKTTGDGVLATFDGPGRGIAFATAVGEALRPLGIVLRAGVHTGEVERRGEDVAGVGVVIARRICDLAQPHQVLVSRTVKDLVTGSQVRFTEHGVHELKGLEESWQLYAVDPDELITPRS